MIGGAEFRVIGRETASIVPDLKDQLRWGERQMNFDSGWSGVRNRVSDRRSRHEKQIAVEALGKRRTRALGSHFYGNTRFPTDAAREILQRAQSIGK